MTLAPLLASLIRTAESAKIDAHSTGSTNRPAASVSQARANALPRSVGTRPIISGPIANTKAPIRISVTFTKIMTISCRPPAPISSSPISGRPPNAAPAIRTSNIFCTPLVTAGTARIACVIWLVSAQAWDHSQV